MKIEKLKPKTEKILEFSYSKQKHVPNSFGCYVISNFNHEILYIGKATSLRNRFTNHLETKEKNKLTPIGKSYWFSYRECSDQFEISRLERGWLNSYELEVGELPYFNKIHAG